MSANSRWMIALILVVFSWTSVRAQDAEVIKVEIGLVTVNVSVTDTKGRPLSGLTAGDFLVTDEGKPVALEFFDNHGPASIIFVIDMSASMSGDKWRSLKAGLKKFLATAREGNDYTLIAFNDRPQLIARAVSADQLWPSISSLNPSGHTALYDAVLLGLNVLEQTPQRHKALVLLSDGADNSSRARLADVQQEALAHRATIYTVGILFRQRDLFADERNGQELLKELAVGTGGLASFPNLDEIREVLEKINADMSNQYSLGYYAPERAPGWRSIQVSIAPGGRRFKLRYQPRYLIR